MSHIKLSLILFGLNILFRYCSWRYPEFKESLRGKNFVAQIRTKDGTVGRWYKFGQNVYKCVQFLFMLLVDEP